MSDIGPGDWVQALRDVEHPRAHPCRVDEGSIWQAREVCWGIAEGETLIQPALQLVNDGLPEDCGWRLADFKKVGDKGAFDHLLVVAPETETLEAVRAQMDWFTDELNRWYPQTILPGQQRIV